MTLRTKVINLIGFNVEDQVRQTLAIRQIAVVQKQTCAALMWINIKMINSTGIETTGSSDKSMNTIPFFK